MVNEQHTHRNCMFSASLKSGEAWDSCLSLLEEMEASAQLLSVQAFGAAINGQERLRLRR